MYISPETNVRILKNVPLDNTYRDTIYFTSASEQSSYFITKQKYNLTNYSYQRVQRGWIRVGVRAENLYDCNYLMFQNSAFGTKWFYAFITAVEYINNECSQIQFEIDVMQTWYFDYTLKQCMVERQHVANDSIYTHIEPENVELGDMVTNGTSHTPSELSGVMRPVLCMPKPLNSAIEDENAYRYNGMPSGAVYLSCDNNDESIYHMYQSISDQDKNAIISMYLLPTEYIPGYNPTSHKIDENGAPIQVKFNNISVKPNDFDGYVPRNNKLYNSPFVNLEFTDQTDNKAFYKPELFHNKTGVVSFTSRGAFVGSPEVLILPDGYRGDTVSYDNAFSISEFPQCATPSDSFRAYLAQQGGMGGITFGFLSSIFGAFMGGNLTGMASGGMGAINNLIKASNSSNSTRSRDSSGVVGCNGKLPYYRLKTVTGYYAKMIDDYFTVYGYHISDLKVPNIHARSSYTYVKTDGCCTTGSVPVDDMAKIKSNYDKGITFWVNGVTVGNYDATNTPLNNE